MIDISREQLISLAEAAKYFPCSRPGKRVHVGAVYRAVSHGHGGVRLEAVRTPRLATTREAIERFFRALTEQRLVPDRQRPSRPTRERRQEQIDWELDQLGL